MPGNGFILVLVGLLLLWVVISGKFNLMEAFFYQLFDIPTTKLSESDPQKQIDSVKKISGEVLDIEELLYGSSAGIERGEESEILLTTEELLHRR